MPGKFIVLEGEDDVLLNRIAEYFATRLWAREIAAVITYQPTKGPIGGQIRLTQDERLHFDDATLAVLSLADRMDHLHHAEYGVLTHLEAGQWVICQHYLLSAYVQRDETVSLEWLAQINQLCPWPDLVIFVEPSVPQKRQQYYQRAIAHCKARGKHTFIVNDARDMETLLHICWAQVESAVLA